MVRLSQLLELDVRQALQFQGIIAPDPLPVVLASSGLRVATAALTTADCPDGRPRAGDVGATAGARQDIPGGHRESTVHCDSKPRRRYARSPYFAVDLAKG